MGEGEKGVSKYNIKASSRDVQQVEDKKMSFDSDS